MYRYHGVELMDAEVTQFRVSSSVNPTQGGTGAKRRREEARMTATVAPNRDGAGISTRISTQRLMGRVPATTYNYAGDETASIRRREKT